MKIATTTKSWLSVVGLVSVVLLALIYTLLESSENTLLRELRSADPATRTAAAQALLNDSQLDMKKLLPDLVRCLGDPVPDVRFYVALILGAAGQLNEENARLLEKATPALVDALGDDDARVREAAAKAVGLIMPAPPRSTASSLSTRLRDPERKVRKAALGALARITDLDVSVLREIVRVMKEDESGQVRGEAARALGERSAGSLEVVPALVAALDDRDNFVRQQAIRALGKIGPPAAAAIPALEAIVRNLGEEPKVREYANYALSSISK